MAKQKKKRNKVYHGADAVITRPTITHIEAVSRSKIGQWWFEKKRFAKPVLIATGVVILIIGIVFELFRLF